MAKIIVDVMMRYFETCVISETDISNYQIFNVNKLLDCV